MKPFKRTLSILLALLMLMGLLPLSALSVAAEETILIHEVEATCDLVYPTYGQDFEKPRSFTMTVVGDLPIEFNSSSSDWFLWDGTDWQTKVGGAFTDGTYCYDVHVRVTDDNYALAGDCTITVNGVLWPHPLETGYNQSAPFTIDYVAGLPLVFDKVSNYTIGANYVGKAINSYSVASTVMGGTKPYTFAKTSGPDWITVSADGTVSGTPTAIGDNEDLVITVTDAVGEQASITVPVSGTYIDPEDRRVISRVVADVTYPVLKCGDARTREIVSAVVTEGAPAYLHTSNSDWYVVDGEGHIGGGYYQPTMVAGTYVIDIDLRVDGDAGYTHMLDSNNLEVVINGAPAILKSDAFVSDTYSNVWVYSVPIVIEHTYDNDTDSTCNGCGVTARPGCDHQYAAACDDVCSVCGATRVVADNLHTYDNAFDTACNGCGETRAINYIAVGDTKTVALTDSGEYLDFVFAPTVSGKYAFYSTSEGSLDTYGLLYDADENLLKNDDQSGGQGHFKITFDATAGTSYILRAKMYGSLTPTVPFEVKLVCVEHVYTNGCDPTCDICGETRTDFIHTYDNGLDTTCNECGATRAIHYIAIGETKTAAIPVAGQKAEFVFTPTATAKYIFTSLTESGDPYGEIFLPDGTKIESDDDSGDSRNFKVEYTLEAGVTYILCARYYSASAIGSYEVKLECGHAYDNACDAICNACAATREVGEHQYSNACDADCNVCGAIRESGEHTYTDCTDTSCNACGTTRTAPGHVYDGCEDTECNGCGKTRTAPGHDYDSCDDTTCDVCGATREAGEHTYTDCADTSCNACSTTRTAPGHVYDGCEDTTCNACGATRSAQEHRYHDCYATTCEKCGYTRSDVPAHNFGYSCTPYCTKCGAPNPDAVAHTYDGDCDDECNVCVWCRIPPHTYGDDDTCDACGKGRLIVLDRIDLTIADDSWIPEIGDTLDYDKHLPTATVEGGIPFEAANGDDGWRVYDETTDHWNWMDKGDVFEAGKTYQYWWLFIGCTEDKATTLYRLSEDVKVYVNGVLWSIMDMSEDFWCGTKSYRAYCYVTAPAITLGNFATITKESATAAYAKEGDKVSVKVTATGDDLKYTWYIKNDGKTTYSKSSVTSATYSTTMSDKAKNRRVYCVVTDKYGNSVRSKTFMLRESVSITKEPATAAYAKKGAKASIKIAASGDGLKYQWYIKNDGASKYTKSSITSATYSATMSDKVKGRKVYCVVTDKYGKKVQSKTFLLRESVSITTQPKTVTVKKNATAKVTVKASGDGLKYTWYVKDAGKTKYSKSSITKSTYSVKMTSKVKNRLVYCVVTDKYGNTVKTVTVKLKMK